MSDRQDSKTESAVSRRVLLQGVAGVAALAASPPLALAQAAPKEAPELARMVAENRLPPLDQRLPRNPMVVTPHETVGRYGGTLRRGLRGSSDHNGILRMVGNQGLVRWNLEFTQVLPNVAERWDVNATATEFVFHLRQGMKWSDGKPFTADDVVFAIEDCTKNSELYRSVPSVLTIGGKPAVVTKVSDTAVKFAFEAPYAMFLENLATPLGQHPTLFPKHYCSQFHPKYNTGLDAQVRAANLSDWPTLFRARCGDIEIPSRWGNAEKPTLDPWVVAEAYTGGATRVTMRRNPYFWQVDTNGAQLPYIDQLTMNISQDVESLMLDTISGRIDRMKNTHVNALAVVSCPARKKTPIWSISSSRVKLRPLCGSCAAITAPAMSSIWGAPAASRGSMRSPICRRIRAHASSTDADWCTCANGLPKMSRPSSTLATCRSNTKKLSNTSRAVCDSSDLEKIVRQTMSAVRWLMAASSEIVSPLPATSSRWFS